MAAWSALDTAQVLCQVCSSWRVHHSVCLTARAPCAQRTLRGAKSALACSLRGLLPSGPAASGTGRPATRPRAPSACSGRHDAARPPPEPRTAPRPTSASSGGSGSSRVRSMLCLGERGSGTSGEARGAAGGARRPGVRGSAEGAPLLGGARERGGRVSQVRYTRRRSLRPMCMASVFTTGPPLPSSNWRPTQVPLRTFPVFATSSVQGRCSARTSDRAPARRAAGCVAASGAARPAGRLTRGTHCSASLSKRAVSSVRYTARQRGNQALLARFTCNTVLH